MPALACAFLEDAAAHGVLHGLRCGGCRLEVGTPEEKMKFNFGNEMSVEEKHLAVTHAKEHQEYLEALFTRLWHGAVGHKPMPSPRYRRNTNGRYATKKQ